MNNKYDDIINLEYPVSKRHKRMPINKRAAQFMPFKALTGYEEKIKETERITEKKIELSKEEKNNLNNKLQIINEHLKSNPKIIITYFVKDNKKQGGKYITISTIIKKIDIIEKKLILIDKTKINLSDIIQLEGEILNFLEQ